MSRTIASGALLLLTCGCALCVIPELKWSLSGRVRVETPDGGGEPISGAAVVLHCAREPRCHDECPHDGQLLAVSNPDGTIGQRGRVYGPWSTCVLEVSAPGFVSKDLTVAKACAYDVQYDACGDVRLDVTLDRAP